MCFRVGDKVSVPIERSRSALTGNLLAGTVARMALEDSLLLARNDFKGAFMLNTDLQFDAMCWSDNIATYYSTYIYIYIVHYHQHVRT